MADTIKGLIQQQIRTGSDNTPSEIKLSRRSEVAIVDWYTQQVLEGRAFNVRAGTLTTPVESDIDITDTAAEMCTDAGAGMAIMPVYATVDMESLSGGTIPNVVLKSVGTVSSAGAVFVAMPLYLNDNSPKSAARSTSRVAVAGGITVTADTVATTRAHYSESRVVANLSPIVWEPRTPPVVANDACFYVQIGTVTAGVEYFAAYDFIEMETVYID